MLAFFILDSEPELVIDLTNAHSFKAKITPTPPRLPLTHVAPRFIAFAARVHPTLNCRGMLFIALLTRHMLTSHYVVLIILPWRVCGLD